MQTDAAFILLIALHLKREKVETEEVKLSTTLEETPTPVDFLFPLKEPFSLFRLIGSQTNGPWMSSRDIFHRVEDQLMCWVNKRCFLYSNRDQEQGTVGSERGLKLRVAEEESFWSR